MGKEIFYICRNIYSHHFARVRMVLFSSLFSVPIWAGLMIVYICGMVYYYVICNYVIDTPIGIWPLILYCFLLAVPGDIALSILGAVIAKRVRPVVHQYLFDSKSNVRLKTEELAK